ncbi:uncharacterized protein MONOS_9663 [Monocercomonoides exilis]|uniref:uncharacterized protein n=1 Tax=Monocercomonoides exilis TaxID=2049356 RepID=UPI00355A6CCB|nr:hypothetical protein MONOS_9663 [Monocercomonoides exilis]|eukprot:MONOS_9663.1-p1 / transcript=MONOS_9663.1 / gene=MONOS_9663 / organism=Monocercomonoides_exilis_PA203 / gene_product=unspecified product / transcript_product=unspecified product / location=Mono_scaffold00407:18569-18989(-) / protein_length=126 / sequence_SO=supercontig / SO=protein_coding / is_pseudo=false
MIKKKAEEGKRKMQAEMASIDYRIYENRLERMARILIDGKARLVDATNFGEFSKKTLIHTVKAVKSDRDIAKVGRPSLLRKEKKDIVTDVIKIETKCGTNLTVKKTKELIENVIEDEDSEIIEDA